ncbi:MAG: hypothetical protein IJI98_03565 [Methanosphaera sp.]|nr:hypothetical protein [Methanosphaera sp.]
MTENTQTTNNNYFDNYDFLNFSYKQIPNFKLCKKFGGKNGIGFESNPEKNDQLIEEINNDPNLKTQKILKGNPSNIIINENTLHHFKFTICKDYMEYLPGQIESKESIQNAIKLSSDFVYISQDNFDSDVVLLKRGFKTNYSDWTAYTNHMTSNIYFNILFEYYKLGLIEDYIIFYTEPIKNSDNKYIHPLNSSPDQDTYDSEIHAYKKENMKFNNIFHKLNIIITVKGYKDIDKILEKIEEEKSILYDSRNGIYEKDLEGSIEDEPEPKKGLLGKVNNFLS